MGQTVRTSRAVPTVTVLVAGALAATAASAVAATPHHEVSRGVAIPSFYNPPRHLPKGNGTLVRTQPMKLGASISGNRGPLPGKATRLMYTSTDATGHHVAVTGVYIEPTRPWQGNGPRPLAAVASGTMGQGDQCAPSLALQHVITLNTQTASIAYEDLAVYRLLARGIAVVVTDYVGLGTTNAVHTYVNRLDEAHALLDAARAALKLKHTSLTAKSKIALYGYSQGGGAAAAAAEDQPKYAPHLHLAGTYAGAPPANLTQVIKGIDGSALAGALGWSINGFAQSYPAIRRIISANVNRAGKKALADLSTMCVGDVILHYGFSNSKKWTKSGRSLSAIIASHPKLKQVLAAQRIGRLRPTSPVRVATGVQDDIVVHAQARRLAVDWCAKGANVTYVPINLPNLGDGLLTNHVAPLLTDQGDAIAWLTARLNGKHATSNCSTIASKP